MRQRLTAIPQSLILHKTRGYFVENCIKHNNKRALLHLRVLFAWAMKFNRKYRPIHTFVKFYSPPDKTGGVWVLRGLFFWGGEGGRPWIDQVRLAFLAQREKRARFACERARKWLVSRLRVYADDLLPIPFLLLVCFKFYWFINKSTAPSPLGVGLGRGHNLIHAYGRDVFREIGRRPWKTDASVKFMKENK